MPGTPDVSQWLSVERDPRGTEMWSAVSQSDPYLTTNSLAAGNKLSVPECQKGCRPIGLRPFWRSLNLK